MLAGPRSTSVGENRDKANPPKITTHAQPNRPLPPPRSGFVQQGARANDPIRHARCLRTGRSGWGRGSSLTLAVVVTMKHFTFLWSLLAFALCGCSDATRPPAKFSQQLSTADRLEVTNRYFAFGTTITGADVSSLTTAVKSATKKTAGTNLDWMSPSSWEVVFYAGTNRLADIPICHGIFKLEGVEYNDGTGFAEQFWKKLEEDRIR